ncbi:alanine--tRNA ligase [Helicobacter sp. XJK30-2]|uniref:Alanine--tRNA ligase n=1 Tax=Helicobacter zhangjianzhongii TaxID=2974574 RepID=A0ACC6FQK0_9HELI|nr:alanine--tRNA ligase [Helicobacter sp. XJK30-2]MDL0081534.1 alanine--tRNA ligase [Helicobacter sp. XJK30-2]
MDIRAKFLEFFEKKGHKVYSSMPLVPDDASLLFTNAGMVQFKDIFTGKIPAPSPNIATSAQLCIRAGGKHNDLENVGYTARHHTLFEMLGNFSFGAYFKKEAIAYAWEFVTEILGFDKSLLYVTIHESDDEAYELWCEHIEPERIKRMGDKDNFWQMGDTGPCGPCSEIYVDQGAEFFNGEEDYFGGEGDRFLEIWNLVFMQYERDSSGALKPLPKPSIDTGMGLERVVALKEGKRSNFDSSLFVPLIHKVESLSKQTYIYESGASFRVIADHARAVAFLLAQGVNFDKEGRGYVLRRILRRAVRHGYLLGLRKAFLYEVVGVVCDTMGGHYSYLQERKNALQEQCKAEEERFFETIELGMALFQAELEKLRGHSANNNSSLGNHSGDFVDFRTTADHQSSSALKSTKSPTSTTANTRIVDSTKQDSSNSKIFDEKCGLQGKSQGSYLSGELCDFSQLPHLSQNATHFSGEVAFKLYDTYGFPLDLTQDMLRELDLSVDLQGFEKCMQEQKDRSKAHWRGSGDTIKEGDFNALLSEYGENEFVGYERMSVESKILALLDSGFKRIESLEAGQEGWVMLEDTPFYPESGGPVGDTGVLLGLGHSACNNSSLGNHCTDFTNFERTADLKSSSPSKFVKNSTSTTANTRIVDSTPCERELKPTTPKCQESSGAESQKVDSSHCETSLGSRGNPQNIVAKVLDTQKYFGLNLSKVVAVNMLKARDLVKAQVDSSRFEIIKHHSATHLLHYALRQILGSHIAQAGSLVEANRLRFDFSHPRALSVNELEQIEALVNSKIAESSPQICETMGIEQAKAKGAMALFGEKYGESVRVITLGDSVELCGGIHIHNTAEIGSFYIVRESSVSSGVRRIEAVCGKAAYSYGKAALESIKSLKEQLKAQDVLQGVAKLQNALKEARDNANKAKQSVKSLDYEEVNGVKLIVLKLDSVETKEAKDIIDRAKNENEKVAILLVTESSGKVALTAGVKGVANLKAGAWVKQVAQILGGNGGGRDDFATAGGKTTDPNKIQEALDVAKRIAREKLS